MLAGCKSEKTPSPVEPVGKTIGAVTMTKDGIMEVSLRAEGENGTVGDAFFVYKKGAPEYDQLMRLVGGLKRG